MKWMKNYFKQFTIVLLLGVSSTLFLSCEPDGEEQDDVREEYIGTWQVTETNSQFGVSAYLVEISLDLDPNTVQVSNFHNTGESFAWDISFDAIGILEQISEGFTYSGSGTANANFTTCNIEYTVLGGGTVQNVTAQYTKQ